jgi:hypothetical protein
MGFFNKLEDETKRILSQTDDFVNEEIPGGWYTVAALAGGAGYGMNGGFGAGSSASGAGGAGGFSFLPSGEMTVFSPETAGATGGGSNFLSGIFGSPAAGTEFVPDLSGQSTYADIGINPDSMIFDSNMGTYDPASKYYDYSYASQKSQQKPRMPDFGKSAQQQAAQQLADLNQGGDSGGGMRKGQAIPQAILSSLLDPSVALKAYRPTLI